VHCFDDFAYSIEKKGVTQVEVYGTHTLCFSNVLHMRPVPQYQLDDYKHVEICVAHVKEYLEMVSKQRAKLVKRRLKAALRELNEFCGGMEVKEGEVNEFFFVN